MSKKRVVKDKYGFKNDAVARKWLKSRLAIADAKFQALWPEIVRDGVSGRAVAGEITHEEFLEDARDFNKASERAREADRRRGRPRGERKEDFQDLTPTEEARARAFAAYLALQADQDADVKSIRDRLFAGKCLSSRDARKLLGSAAARVASFDGFKRHGIPLLLHEASSELVPYSGEQLPPEEWAVRLKITWDGGSHDEVVDRSHLDLRMGRSLQRLAVPDFPLLGLGLWLAVWPGSVLDEVRIVAGYLSRRFPWRPHEATWFLLTGDAPPVSPLSTSYSASRGHRVSDQGIVTSGATYHRRVLKIEVEPWVNPKSLLKLFMRHHREGTNFGTKRDERQVTARTLTLVEFVIRHLRQKGGKVKSLNAAWTAEYPKWKYRSPSAFETAYERGLTSIAFLGAVHLAKRAPK